MTRVKYTSISQAMMRRPLYHWLWISSHSHLTLAFGVWSWSFGLLPSSSRFSSRKKSPKNYFPSIIERNHLVMAIIFKTRWIMSWKLRGWNAGRFAPSLPHDFLLSPTPMIPFQIKTSWRMLEKSKRLPILTPLWLCSVWVALLELCKKQKLIGKLEYFKFLLYRR